MRSIKILGALAVSALAIALLGATSASATVLCKENVATCPAESIYPSGTSVSGSIEGKFSLVGELPVNCTGSTMSGQTKAEKGGPLPIEISNLTLSGCTQCPIGFENASASASKLPYTAGLSRSSGGEGTATLSSGGGGTPTLKVKCTGFLGTFECGFSLDGLAFGFKGGNPANLSVKEATLKRLEGPGLCGEEVGLTATYTLTSPSPAYASAGQKVDETVFCKESAAVCQSGSIYAKGTSFEAKATGISMFNETTMCNSAISFENQAESGKPLSVYVQSMSFSGCEGTCKTVTAKGLPIGWEATATGGGNGTVNAGVTRLTAVCEVFPSIKITCTYEATNIGATFTGGSSPYVSVPKSTFVTVEGPEGCGNSTVIGPIKYNITTANPLYLSKYEV